ncbi:sulfur carrier protein [Frankineae bacterium MT45]|nr:sulfur carrier protein [Frankineae bacterium MT45]
MNITINGEELDVAEDLTVAELVELRFGGRSGIAIAVDGEVAPRSGWSQQRLISGAAVEVLTAVQGG